MRALVLVTLAAAAGCGSGSEVATDASLPSDASNDAGRDATVRDAGLADASVDAVVFDLAFDLGEYDLGEPGTDICSETCGHRFESGEIVLIEPYYTAGELKFRLAHEIAAGYDRYDLEDACVVVSERNAFAGDVLDGALTAPWWSRLGRAAGEPYWILDMSSPYGWEPGSGNPPFLGLIMREVPTGIFSAITLDVSLASGPLHAHVTAWYNAGSEVEEPEWLASSFVPVPPHRFAFAPPPRTPIDGHKWTWGFTHPGDYCVKVDGAMDGTDGRRVIGSGIVHVVVEAVQTPCGACEIPTSVCDVDTETCVQCESASDCAIYPWDRPPGGVYEACFEGRCVECNSSADCPNTFIPECDVPSHTCIPCRSDDVCATEWPGRPVCGAGAGGSCGV